MNSAFFKMATLIGAAVLLAAVVHVSPVAAQSGGTPFPVESFSRVEIEGAGHAVITSGDRATLTISGPQEEIDRLEVRVSRDTLKIEPRNGDHNGSTDIVFHITVPTLSEIELDGSVTAELDGLTAESLRIEMEDSSSLTATKLAVQRLDLEIEGGASISLAGTAEFQQIEIEDSGTYDGLGLDSRTVPIEAEGSSISRVRVSESLSGQIEDSAVVEYMTELGVISIRSDDAARLTQLTFEPLGE